ncbi:hypothetical protein R1sor_010237 [Riccia sorocarpa]|uniref:Fe2OG dioxygenase domain-containing protein n=1 Tax=Riccia sorocarpa TaxID=122646 RepID=A0ABD3I1H1_9MARC
MGLEDSLVDKFREANLKDESTLAPRALDPTDPTFVLDPEFRRKVKHDEFLDCLDDQIPVIDLTPLGTNDEEALGNVIAKVRSAVEEWGFFQVVNHGVPLELIDRLEKEAVAFFSLPLEEKKKVCRTFDLPTGYNNAELTKNHRDWKEVFDLIVRGSIVLPDESNTTHVHVFNQWPQNRPALREAAEAYAKSAEQLAFRILGLLSRSLGLPAEYFHKYFEYHASRLRLNYYPVCAVPDLALGVSRHKDASALTILVQDEVGGLQVRRKGGEWIAVKPRREAFVINVGAVFQVWSNDRWKSIEHQVVVNENRARLSFPLFFNPCPSVDVEPAPEILSESNPARYYPINWGLFMRKRYDGNFKQYGEDIQIEHFAVNRVSPYQHL